MSVWLRMCRARRTAVVVRAEEKATLDLNEGVEGGTDYSGILAGERSANALPVRSCERFHVCWRPMQCTLSSAATFECLSLGAVHPEYVVLSTQVLADAPQTLSYTSQGSAK